MLEEVRFEVDKEVPAQTDIYLDDVGRHGERLKRR